MTTLSRVANERFIWNILNNPQGIQESSSLVSFSLKNIEINMPLPIQKQREALLQILYSKEFEGTVEIIPFMMAELKATRSSMAVTNARADLILSELNQIDPMIAEASTEYRLERISRIEKWILRMSLFELIIEQKTPPKVVIAEAIRLCRKFGTRESAEFINAIIDGIYKNHAAKSTERALSL